MDEGLPLLALNVVPDSIWGHEDETIVYAQAIGKGRALIFRFYLDPGNPPQSLPTRIVNYYHGSEVSTAQLVFKDRGAMRSLIWSTIATVWPSCIAEPRVFEPGTVIDLVSDETGGVTWDAYREPHFDRYLDLLRGIRPSELIPQDGHPARVIDISQVAVLSALGGRGCCKQVEVKISPGDPSTFVFKGVDFQTYLQVHDNDDEFARATVEVWRRSSRLIASMPRHPYIQSPPKMLVSVHGADGDKPVLVGHLSTFLAKGDVATVIALANSTGTPISLLQKAQWSLQMSLAIAYTHNSVHTFHMDIKPGNFVVDDQENLSLIDWEQSGAPATTLAPEADGTWDVNEVDTSKEQGVATTRLVYTKYTGPKRRNMPEGSGREPFNIWNAFPVWQASCPKASELAEVFALGRTMWMLLTQMIEDFEDISHPDDIQITWGNKHIIPSRWIKMVMQCMEKDPNERPLLVDLVKLWKAEYSLLNGPILLRSSKSNFLCLLSSLDKTSQ